MLTFSIRAGARVTENEIVLYNGSGRDFAEFTRNLLVGDAEPLTIDIEPKIAAKQQTVTVTADIKEGGRSCA